MRAVVHHNQPTLLQRGMCRVAEVDRHIGVRTLQFVAADRALAGQRLMDHKARRATCEESDQPLTCGGPNMNRSDADAAGVSYRALAVSFRSQWLLRK
jgi:hypothetical protein